MAKHKAVRFAVLRKRWIAIVAALGLSLSGSLVAASVAQASNAACNVTPIDFGAKHIVSFTSVGACDWTVPAGVSRVEVLLVGGGGGGGHTAGGGGGAGGVIERTGANQVTVTPGATETITIGDGGAGATSALASFPGASGQDSSALGFTAHGGGGGGSWTNGGVDGASGGGAGAAYASATPGSATATAPELGSQGGYNRGNSPGGALGSGGGGGGAGGPGSTGTSPLAGNGGDGYNSVLLEELNNYSRTELGTYGGTPSCIAGGGGAGGGDGGGPGGIPTWGGRASCGGGAGEQGLNNGYSATPNTGSGGGGGGSVNGNGGEGGQGGSGLVVISYWTTPSVSCAPTDSGTGSTHILTFAATGDCSWTIPTGVSSLHVLVVGGGGAGGNSGYNIGGGGGAGGQVTDSTSLSVTAGQTATVSVGAGGTFGSWDCFGPSSGTQSWFGVGRQNGVFAAGGGFGGSGQCANNGTAGGGLPILGGGSAGHITDYLVYSNNSLQPLSEATQNGAAASYGKTGGAGIGSYEIPAGQVSGAGGGGSGASTNGASASANAGVTAATAGAGGEGVSSNISGSTLVYGSGGGGGDSSSGGAGGTRGGHGGCSPDDAACVVQTMTDGEANSGAGGGGMGVKDLATQHGGAGGSGIVIVQYSTGPSAPGAPTNLVTTGQVGGIQVACTDAPSNGASLSNYQFSTDGGTTWRALSPVDTSCPVTVTTSSSTGAALTYDPNNDYPIQLRGVNSVGAGAASSNALGMVYAEAPGAPTATSVTAGNGSATVSCTNATSVGTPLTNYKYSLGGGVWTELSPADASCPLTIPNLTNGTSYTVQIRAVNLVGQGQAVTVGSVTPTSGPTAPVITSITPANQQLTIACTNATNPSASITNYQYSTDGGSNWKTLSPAVTSCPITITKTSVGTNNSLVNGTSYNVQLRAYYSNTNGAASTTVAATPAGVPSAPSSLVGTYGDGSASIACTLGSANGSAITNVEYSTDGGTTWVTPSPALTSCPVTISGLTNGTTYSVKLREVNAIGTGAVSSAVSVTPKALPGMPTINSITPGNQSLTVNCTDAAANGSALTNYEYTTDMGLTWRALSPADSSCPLTITKTSANNTTLVNGTSYPVTIRAINAVGSGTNPSKQNGTPAGAPLAPTGLSAAAGDGSASISCTLGSSNGSDITNIQYSTDGGSTWVTPNPAITTCPVSIPGLTNGTSYSVKLREINDVGTGATSSSVSVKPLALPTAPTITGATPGNTSGAIAWTAPASTGGSAVTSYQYALDGGAWVTISGGGSPANPFTVSSLSNGTAYSIALRAVTAAGASPASNAVTFTPRTVPSAPTSFVVTPGDSTASISFIQGSTGGSAVTDVEWSIDNGATWTSAGPGSTGVSISGVDNGTAYTFKVRAKNVAGNGAIGSTTFTPRTVPAAPVNLSASAKDGSASISFTPGFNGGSSITNYKYSTDGGTTWTALSPADNSGPITIPNLTNGTTYSIALRAVNVAGDGAVSTTVTVTPRASSNNGNSGSSSTPTPSASRSKSPEPTETPEPKPTATNTRTASPTPSPTKSVVTTGVRVFDDLTPITENIRDERDECDKSITREVCNKDTEEKVKEAVDSTKEKSKDHVDESEKKVEQDKKDKDEADKKAKDDDETAKKSEKEAKDKDDKADKSEKKAEESEKKADDDDKEVEADKKKLEKDEKKLSDDEKNKEPAPVITTDKKNVEDDKKELEKDQKKADEDRAQADKDREQADKDRKDAEAADEKAKKDREEADKSEKEAKDKQNELEKSEKELERAKQAEVRVADIEEEHNKVNDADEKEQETEKEKRQAIVDLYPGADLKFVTLCHATGSNSNPYVNITVEVDSWLKKGHGGHTGGTFPDAGWGDIVPAVATLTPMNMVSGLTIFENNCLVPAQQADLATSTPTPFEEPSASATPSASASEIPSVTPSDTLSPSATASASPSETPSATATPSETPSASSSASDTPTATDAPTATASDTPAVTDSPSASASDTPNPSDTSTASPGDSASASPSDTASAEPTPSDTPTPVTVPEVIDDVTVYEDTSKEWHDTIVANIALELEWIDEQANQGTELPMPEPLVIGLQKEKELKQKLDILGAKLIADGNNLVDPKASPELLSSAHGMLSRAGELRDADLKLGRDRAGIADEFPWWIIALVAGLLVLGAGLWFILAYRRKRVYVDFEACTACGLCYERFPELFAKGPGGKAVLRQKSQHSSVVLIDIPERKHHDDLTNFIDQCKDGAIGFSRKVPGEVKQQQRDLNA